MKIASCFRKFTTCKTLEDIIVTIVQHSSFVGKIVYCWTFVDNEGNQHNRL